MFLQVSKIRPTPRYLRSTPAKSGWRVSRGRLFLLHVTCFFLFGLSSMNICFIAGGYTNMLDFGWFSTRHLGEMIQFCQFFPMGWNHWSNRTNLWYDSNIHRSSWQVGWGHFLALPFYLAQRFVEKKNVLIRVSGFGMWRRLGGEVRWVGMWKVTPNNNFLSVLNGWQWWKLPPIFVFYDFFSESSNWNTRFPASLIFCCCGGLSQGLSERIRWYIGSTPHPATVTNEGW